MAHYTIVPLIASGVITFLYGDAKGALAKVRTLQPQSKPFKITDAPIGEGAIDLSSAELTAAELEERVLGPG